jgi:hypothetical protein
MGWRTRVLCGEVKGKTDRMGHTNAIPGIIG